MAEVYLDKFNVDGVEYAIKDALHTSAEMHRNIFRGKPLGSQLTSEQSAQIVAGTFDDLYVGDYWTIGGVNYRIADIDYWLKDGDTEFTKHHLVIVPDTVLLNAQMNKENVTTGAYVGSDLYTGANSNVGLSSAKTTIKAAFGDHILTKRLYMANAVTEGRPSNGAWVNSDIDLMNEINVYGSYIFSVANNGTSIPNIYTVDKTQFALFRIHPKFIVTRTNYWLRDVVSATYFAHVGSHGNAGYDGASSSTGVRPAFAVA